jgi:hypothetical protein
MRLLHEMRDENGRMLVIWPLGRTDKAIIVAIIRRAAAVNAAIALVVPNAASVRVQTRKWVC